MSDLVAVAMALTVPGCVPSHEDDLPSTAVGERTDDARIRLLVNQDHRSGAHVVPVVIEAQRRTMADHPHCIALVGFPGRLDVPLGADCSERGDASDAGGLPITERAVTVCMNLERSAMAGWFEGTRIAAYHLSQKEETFTAFAQLHDDAECEGAPLAEVAVVVKLGGAAPPAGRADASSEDAGDLVSRPDATPPVLSEDSGVASPEPAPGDAGDDGSP